jgi:hypothetical protein
LPCASSITFFENVWVPPLPRVVIDGGLSGGRELPLRNFRIRKREEHALLRERRDVRGGEAERGGDRSVLLARGIRNVAIEADRADARAAAEIESREVGLDFFEAERPVHEETARGPNAGGAAE